jgi:hypothetical protein
LDLRKTITKSVVNSLLLWGGLLIGSIQKTV